MGRVRGRNCQLASQCRSGYHLGLHQPQSNHETYKLRKDVSVVRDPGLEAETWLQIPALPHTSSVILSFTCLQNGNHSTSLPHWAVVGINATADQKYSYKTFHDKGSILTKFWQNLDRIPTLLFGSLPDGLRAWEMWLLGSPGFQGLQGWGAHQVDCPRAGAPFPFTENFWFSFQFGMKPNPEISKPLAKQSCLSPPCSTKYFNYCVDAPLPW